MKLRACCTLTYLDRVDCFTVRMLATIFGYDSIPWEEHRRVVAAIRRTIEDASRYRSGNRYAQKAPYNAPSELPGLDKIVQIDLDTTTAWVEPNVTMEALVRATLGRGLVPAVVAASRTASVGDAFAATTTESSSFKFGTFDCAVLSLETILSDGQYVMATIDDRDTSDLLCGSAGALHSLALTTLLEIALVPVSEHVKITYWPVSSVSEAMRKMRHEKQKPTSLRGSVVDSSTDFVESIMFGSSSGVVVIGSFTLTADRTQMPRSSQSNSFEEHARSIWCELRYTREPRVEIVHMMNYLFRHDDRRPERPVCNKRRSRVPKSKTGPTDRPQAMVLQDIGLPAVAVEEQIHDFHRARRIWPVLIYPVKAPNAFGRRSFGVGTAFEHVFWNLRFHSPSGACDGVMERRLRHMHGFRYLLCRASCSEDTAWVFHDDRWYGELRSRWRAQGFPDVGARLATS